jgi:hypothetical protein
MALRLARIAFVAGIATGGFALGYVGSLSAFLVGT